MPKEIHQIQPLEDNSVEALNGLIEELNVRLFAISRDLPDSDLPYYAKLSDVKAYNVNGGTFTAGAWRTRDLNTEYDPNEIVSLSANRFILQAGTYRIQASAPAYRVGRNVSRLYNISDSSEVILGTSGWTGDAGGYATTRSWVVGQFTITAAKTFEIQHQSTSTFATYGFGIGSDISGVNSVFTVVELWKLA